MDNYAAVKTNEEDTLFVLIGKDLQDKLLSENGYTTVYSMLTFM